MMYARTSQKLHQVLGFYFISVEFFCYVHVELEIFIQLFYFSKAFRCRSLAFCFFKGIYIRMLCLCQPQRVRVCAQGVGCKVPDMQHAEMNVFPFFYHRRSRPLILLWSGVRNEN